MKTKLLVVGLLALVVGCRCGNANGNWACESVPPGIWHAGVDSSGRFQTWADPFTAVELAADGIAWTVKAVIPGGDSTEHDESPNPDGPPYPDGEARLQHYFHSREQ